MAGQPNHAQERPSVQSHGAARPTFQSSHRNAVAPAVQPYRLPNQVAARPGRAAGVRAFVYWDHWQTATNEKPRLRAPFLGGASALQPLPQHPLVWGSGLTFAITFEVISLSRTGRGYSTFRDCPECIHCGSTVRFIRIAALLAAISCVPGHAVADAEIKSLVAKINERIGQYENYEIKLTREGAGSSAREDHYVRKNQYYLHTFTTADGQKYKEVVHFKGKESWAYESGKARISHLSALNYNRLALGDIRYFKGNFKKELKKTRDGKLLLKFTYLSGSGKEYLIDPDTLIVLQRKDFNRQNEHTFTVRRSFINLNPAYADDFFTDFIKATSKTAGETAARKQRNQLVGNISQLLAIILVILLASLRFQRAHSIKTIKGKVAVCAAFFAAYVGMFWLMLMATKGYLSMLLAAMTWKFFQQLDPQLNAYVSPFVQGLIISGVAMIPAYFLLSLCKMGLNLRHKT